MRRVSALSEGSSRYTESEAEIQRQRFEGHNLRIGPGRRVHRVKEVVQHGLRQPTPVCGQPVSRYPLFECEPVDAPVTCRRCRRLSPTPDPVADRAGPVDEEDGQFAFPLL